jgi:predicted transglutaminase-like cysteine proteinase
MLAGMNAFVGKGAAALLTFGLFALVGLTAQTSHAFEVTPHESRATLGQDMIVLKASYAVAWSTMYARYRDISEPPTGWRKAAKDIRELPLAVLLSTVNRYVNAAPYRSDLQVWGKEDYWATPDELFSHGGDCEDFAIAKFFALRAAGLSSSLMRIVILRATASLPAHAVLVVDADTGPSVLDNLKTDTYALTGEQTARVAFAVNDVHMWVPRNSPGYQSPRPSHIGTRRLTNLITAEKRSREGR